MQALHTRLKLSLAFLVLVFAFSSTSLFASSITSPTSGSKLDGGAQTFTWETGGQIIEQWAIYAGSTIGSYDYFVGGNLGHETSTTVLFLPIDGSPVYIRLWLKIAGAWETIDQTYTSAQYTLSLAPGSTLAGANQNFTWTTTGDTINQWVLYAGTTQGSFDHYVGGGANSSNSVTTIVSGLPTDSSVVHFRMWMQVGGYWEKVDVSYNAVAPYSVSPASETTLTSSSEVFSWNTTGGTVDEWTFYAGSSPGGFDYYNDTGSGSGANMSTSAVGLPDNGATIYVTLWLKIEGNWEKVDLTYTAFEAELIAITSPTAGNNIDGSSQQFIWDPQGQTIDIWVLYVGSSEGASNYHTSAGTGTSTSSVASGLPTDSSTVYARLWYQISGESFFRKIDASYTAAPIETAWDRTFGGNQHENLYSSVHDSVTNTLYTVGSKNILYTPGVYVPDGFFVKTDKDGTTIFEQTFGGSLTDTFFQIATDHAGFYYAVGRAHSNNGDITDGNNGLSDALLVKFDSNGNAIWDRTIGGTGSDRFLGLTIDPLGNIYAVGYTNSNNGDITDGNSGGYDALFVKLDNDGNILWDVTIGGTSNDFFNDIVIDSSDNIYAAGWTNSNDGDITDGNDGADDALLVKFDSKGEKLWDVTLGGTYIDSFNAITISSLGNIYAAGSAQNMSGSYDGLLAEYDGTGNKLWHSTVGEAVLYDVAVDKDDNIYAAGSSTSNDVDITDGNNGNFDGLLMKFNSSGGILWDKTVGGTGADYFEGLSLSPYSEIYAIGLTYSNDGNITDGNNGASDGVIFKFIE